MHISKDGGGTTTRRQVVLLQEAVHLGELPEFARAVREYTDALARFREAPRVINKLTSYETRFRVILYLLYLHADRERFGPEGGATYARILQLCMRRREVNPRVLKTTLALLKLTGLIGTRRNPDDQRSMYYHPTARMSEFVNRWLSMAVNPLDVLQPHLRRAQRLNEEPAFVEAFLVSAGRDYVVGIRPAYLMPEFMSFFWQREGASAIVAATLLSSFDGTPLPSRDRLARRFGLSKTQVSSIIVEGARLGYFEVNEAGVPTPSPRLREDYGRWVSIDLTFYARHMPPA
ncbi:MAG TPA: hypothetical protein VMB48_10035 [Steroidobacteraceae bacterium]|nr:hypothetical protein [Steroidobacteraceae bacterium]